MISPAFLTPSSSIVGADPLDSDNVVQTRMEETGPQNSIGRRNDSGSTMGVVLMAATTLFKGAEAAEPGGKSPDTTSTQWSTPLFITTSVIAMTAVLYTSLRSNREQLGRTVRVINAFPQDIRFALQMIAEKQPINRAILAAVLGKTESSDLQPIVQRLSDEKLINEDKNGNITINNTTLKNLLCRHEMGESSQKAYGIAVKEKNRFDSCSPSTQQIVRIAVRSGRSVSRTLAPYIPASNKKSLDQIKMAAKELRDAGIINEHGNFVEPVFCQTATCTATENELREIDKPIGPKAVNAAQQKIQTKIPSIPSEVIPPLPDIEKSLTAIIYDAASSVKQTVNGSMEAVNRYSVSKKLSSYIEDVDKPIISIRDALNRLKSKDISEVQQAVIVAVQAAEHGVINSETLQNLGAAALALANGDIGAGKSMDSAESSINPDDPVVHGINEALQAIPFIAENRELIRETITQEIVRSRAPGGNEEVHTPSTNAIQTLPLEFEKAPNSLYRHPTTLVLQSEIAFANARSNRVISSAGAGPCILMAVRHRGTKNGFLAHIYSSSEVYPWTYSGSGILQKLKKQMKKDNAHLTSDNSIEVFSAGGYPGQSELVIGACRSLVRKMNEFVKVHAVHETLNKRSITSAVMDFDKGKMYEYEPVKDKNHRLHANILANLPQGLFTTVTHLANPLCSLWETDFKDQKKYVKR